MKSKKAEINSVIFIIIISVLIFSAIIFFSFQQIKKINERNIQIDIFNFEKTLGNLIKEQQASSYGSVSEKSLSLSDSVDKVCFVDRENEINEFTNINLNSDIQIYTDKNIFFYPSAVNPIDIELFSLQENPLCIRTLNGKINLRFVNTGNKTMIEAQNENQKAVDCVNLNYNGNSAEKMDIVFLGYDYNGNDFNEDVNDYINNIFLQSEPYKSNSDKFNFYRIDSANLDCNMDIGYIQCNDFQLKSIASNCPNDYVFVLVNRNKILNFAKPIRSSAIANTAKINTADNKLVLMHEFGHAFGKLADEYKIDYVQTFNLNDYKNCDYDELCINLENNEGCFSECSMENYYRGTEKSIMRNYDEINVYGSVDENLLKKRVEVYP